MAKAKAGVITLKEYWKGRDKKYSKELTDEIIANAKNTLVCTNKLLALMAEDGVDTTDVGCNSGWRPAAVNAKYSKDTASPHIYAQAIDLSDDVKALKAWVGKNPKKVLECGFVATETFSKSPTWLHLQTRKPLSWQMGKAIELATKNGWKNNFTKKVKKVMIPSVRRQAK